MLTLMNALVHSVLYYCNSLFYGISGCAIANFQFIQNRAAKVVAGGYRYDHVTPILKDLHWLTIDKKIIFKISALMFKCINGLAPKYLSDKLELRSSVTKNVNLRVHDHNHLTVPPSRLKIGSRSFAVSGPVIWNTLPHSLRKSDLSIEVFKKQLKSYLFVN